MNSYFTSDEHYNHQNIIKFCKRPFSCTEEMTEMLIQNHNQIVKPTDETYHLGDIFWKHTPVWQANSILDRLNGKHYLIWGNHDEVAKQVKPRFEWTKDLHTFKEGKVNIVLCHYAMRVWYNQHYGSYCLYGHSHGQLPEDKSLSYDIGVDCWNYFPVSIEEVVAKMKKKAEMPGAVPEFEHKFEEKWDKTNN